MRILVNGWFLDELATGSGQYLAALAEWLPRVGEGHEFIVVKPTKRRVSESASQRISESTNQRINESRNRHSPPRSVPLGFAHSPIRSFAHSPIRTPFDHLNANLAKLWFEQVAFPWACRRLGADVAFVPYWGSPYWAPCPVVVTVHDLIPLLLPQYRGALPQRWYTWLVGRTARRAAAVLTDSEASKRDIVTRLGIPADRVHAIHLAADARYRPVTDRAALAQVRTKYNLPDDSFVLYLGGFDARKNVIRTLEAFARLVSRDPTSDVALVIAGKLPARDSDFAPDPRPLVERLGIAERVRFIGWVDEADKPALYTLAAATVFVSEYEGFGLPVLEAMACDTNRSRVGGSSAASKHDQQGR